jgi:hypothetical protein
MLDDEGAAGGVWPIAGIVGGVGVALPDSV